MFEQQFNCGVTCRYRLMQELGYANKQIGYTQDFCNIQTSNASLFIKI
jgi:hypothetical protein